MSKPRVLIFFFILCFFSESIFSSADKDCSGLNHPNYQDEYRACLRLEIANRAGDEGVDCIDCLFGEEEKGPAAWVQALAAVAQPLAYLGSAYVSAKYQYKAQEAWASAYSNAYTQCTNRFNSYLNYNTQAGANPLTSTEAQALMQTCNGNSYSSYAGFGGYVGNGYGGFSNPLTAGGYSGGFMSGMVGPYFGGMSAGGFGTGLGIGLYSGLSGSLYGGSPYGMYGQMGMSSSPYALNYQMSPYENYGASMYGAGMGVNSMYGGSGIGSSVYGGFNLSAQFGVGGSSGFAF